MNANTTNPITPAAARFIGGGLLIFALAILGASSSFVVDPGFRGVEVTLGTVSAVFKPEGFGMKLPFVTRIVQVSIRQQTHEIAADCYSSDLQQIRMSLRVLYRIPEASVVSLYRAYAGDPFESLVAPRVQEAVKEVTAMQSAEQIVQHREEIKTKALEAARLKVGDILYLEDIVIENIALSKELEAAIEAKMVQEQEAAKARFIQQKAQIEADTQIIRARGEAEAIRIQGDALQKNPKLVELRIVERWDGKAPLAVGNGSGANMLLPLAETRAAASR